MKLTRRQLQLIIKESYKSWDVTQRFFGDRFKDDYRQPIDPEKSRTDFKPALLVTPYAGDLLFILWRPRHKSIIYGEQSEIMAMIHASPTQEPCIPVTYEISQSAVNPSLSNEKGYGSLIYGLVFQYMREKGFGLTSDHSISSSKAAQSLWNRYADTKTFVKRKTPDGNDTFDYYKKTDDENDDCSPGLGVNKMATHSSWMTTSDNYKGTFDTLFNQSSDYFRSLHPDSQARLKRDLITKSFERS